MSHVVNHGTVELLGEEPRLLRHWEVLDRVRSMGYGLEGDEEVRAYRDA